jgi:hypothetical protein
MRAGGEGRPGVAHGGRPGRHVEAARGRCLEAGWRDDGVGQWRANG